MSWTVASIPDQTGRVAVVTGGNGGLGLETVRVLAGKGATVVIAARNPDKSEAARREVVSSHPEAEVEARPLDLGSIGSVRSLADAILADHEVVDLLFNNAGVMGTPRMETGDGFELQLGTNHLGHFALTAALMPALLRSPAGRVVGVTSFGRLYRWRLDPDDLHLETRYDPWRAYGRAKAANFLFGLELDRRLRLAGARAESLVAHPGFSHTELQAESARLSGGTSQRFFAVAVRRFGMSPARAALSILRAGTDPKARGGELYGPLWFTFGPPVRKPVLLRREDEAEELWRVSEEATGADFDVPALVAGPSD